MADQERIAQLEWALKQLGEYRDRYIDGQLTAEEYAPYKARAIALRAEIEEEKKKE